MFNKNSKSTEIWGCIVLLQDGERIIFSRSFDNKREKEDAIDEVNSKAIWHHNRKPLNTFWVKVYNKKSIYDLIC